MKRLVAAGLVLALAACSQTAQQAVTPSSPLTAMRGGRLAHATLTIRIPREKKRHGRTPGFISPATKSLTYSLDGGSAKTVALTPDDNACSVGGPVTYLVCTVALSAAPGSHAMSISTTDQPDGSGDTLSANDTVSVNLKAGKDNAINVTLGGIAQQIVPAVLGSPRHVFGADVGGGFAVYGHGEFVMGFTALDADGNAIVGPGAPHASIDATPAHMTIATPDPAKPNRWHLASTFAASDPTVPASVTLSVTASPVPNSGGIDVTAKIPLKLYQPWIYEVSYGANNMPVWDTDGNLIGTLTGFSGVSAPSGLAYDAADNILYVLDASNNTIYAFNPTGTVRRVLSGTFPGVRTPFAIAYDPDHHQIYAGPGPNNDALGLGAFDRQGNAVVPTGSKFPNVSNPTGVAYDSHNGLVYVTNALLYVTPDVTAYDTSGNQQTLSGSFTGASGARAILFDPHNNLLYVASYGAVLVFDEDGNPISTPGGFPGLDDVLTTGITMDPYTGHIFVKTNTHIAVFDEDGNPITVSGSFATQGNQNILFVP